MGGGGVVAGVSPARVRRAGVPGVLWWAGLAGALAGRCARPAGHGGHARVVSGRSPDRRRHRPWTHWSVALPGYATRDALQVGSNVVAAAISLSASSGTDADEWLFYRLRDG